MKNSFVASILVSALLASSGVQAGEYLHLKAGRFGLSSNPSLIESGATQTSRVFVIQFKQPISEKDRRWVASQGLQIKRYLPDDALLVRGSVAGARFASTFHPGVRAVVPFASSWKISGEFTSEKASVSPETIMISLFDEADQEAALSELKIKSSAEILQADGRDLIVEMPAAEVTRVAEIDAVEWIQKLPVLITFDYSMEGEISDTPPTPARPALTGHESGTKIMNFDIAWERGYLGQGQVASMADTGVDSGVLATLHMDLKPVVTQGFALGIGATTWDDPQGHGTHVCGSVVGTGVASQEAIRGGAYGAKMLPSGIWSPILNNIAFPSDFNKLFGTTYKEGARIHTNSWGSPRNLGEYEMFASKTDEFIWNNPDMLILFAAGNSGEDANQDGRIDEGSIGSPGTAKNVLTVGASENLLAEGGIQKTLREMRDGDKKWGVEPLASDKLSDNAQGIAAFSSRGPTLDGRTKPEIVAPGTNIISTRSHHPKATTLWGAYDDEYVYAGGTSMSTPLTAGAATVTREYLVKARGIANPSGALVKAALIHTAQDLFPGQYGTGPKQELPKKRPNVHEGYGRVDMSAVTALQAETILVDEKQGVAAKEERAVSLTLAKAGMSLRVTMTYADAPAAPSAAKALVNDLDLKVIDPAGKEITLADRVNNTEMLELSGLAAGDYRIIVKGVNVPQGKGGRQPYALVATQF